MDEIIIDGKKMSFEEEGYIETAGGYIKKPKASAGDMIKSTPKKKDRKKQKPKGRLIGRRKSRFSHSMFGRDYF